MIVTGFSANSSPGDYDYLTIAYTQLHGTVIWQHRNNGLGGSDDDAYALAVSPDSSHVAVTGGSTGSGTGFDWLTIDYTTS